MTRRSAILVTLTLLFAVIAGCGLRFAWFLQQPVAPPAPRQFTVPAGAAFARVATMLEAEGVIGSAVAFKLYARLRDDSRHIKAGEYEFRDPATPGAVLDRLIAGDVRRFRFTVPEGFNLTEIAAKLAAEGRGDAQVFLSLARDHAFIETLGLDVPTLEGYLFPETYTLTHGAPADRLIRAMVEQFRRRLDPAWVDAAAARGLDAHQLVILASIVQKEAGNDDEMPLISSVFHNRLRRGMRLQADPTVIYGIAEFDGNLTRRHLNTPTPYNTYRMSGLPSGPIASPGATALKAAALPEKSDFLYFVATGDGAHVFSRTLEEHNRMVRRYQLRR